MYVQDYHIHAQFSNDSDAAIENYCKYAWELGVPEIALTEHLTLYERDKNFCEFNYRQFISEVERCKRVFNGKVAVKAGIEVDYHPHLEQKLKDLISGWDELDLVIGSIHYVKEKSVINYNPSKSEVGPLIRGYFSIMDRLVSSGICDVIGHFDVFRRAVNGKIEWQPYLSTLKKILRKIAEKGMAIEINTSGFQRGLNDIFPCGNILSIFQDCGGKHITIGSDAHHVEELAREQAKGIAKAKLAGFNNYTCYKRRQPYLVSF